MNGPTSQQSVPGVGGVPGAEVDVGGSFGEAARVGKATRVGELAVVGDPDQVAGFGLAGARVLPARTPAEAVHAWAGLTAAGLVVLTPAAADWLGSLARAPGAPLTVVLPR